MPDVSLSCPVCGGVTAEAGSVTGRFVVREFHLRTCDTCHFGYVVDPLEDFSVVYSADYYRGEGADPLVNYVDEVTNPEDTIRVYEWRGVLGAVGAIVPISRDTRWLDLGCGLGGLVTYLRDRGVDAVGADEGWGVEWCRDHGIPTVDAMTTTEHFDIITSVEVIEHIPDPVPFLRRAHDLLKPGGLLWLTTGNAEPWRGRLADWRYVIPEIHVSFFEPGTMDEAMRRAGLVPSRPQVATGHADIVRFKVLKTLRRDRRDTVERLVPWGIASHLIDRRYGAMRHPFGLRPIDDAPSPD